MSGWFGLALAAVGCALVWVAFAAPPHPPAGDPLLSEAERLFWLQSYNEAILKARAFVETKPDAERVNAANRIIGISQVRLGQLDEGSKTLRALVGKDPKFSRDTEVLESLARALLQTGRPYAEVLKTTNAAVSLAIEAKNTALAVSLLTSLAEYQSNRIYNLDGVLPRPRASNEERLVSGVATVLATYDRILELSPPLDDQFAALERKADVLRQYGYALRNLPREKWPPGVATPYDLSKPFDLAITFERELVRHAGKKPLVAAAALLRIGEIQESNSQFLAALESYGELLSNFPGSGPAREATKRVAGIKGPQIFLQVTGVSFPGTKPKFGWNARNVAKIELAAYPVDLFELLRALEGIRDLSGYSLKGKTPAHAWSIETGDKADHVPTQSKDPVKAPFSESNAYLVVARGENAEKMGVEARALFLVSRLGLVAKAGKAKTLYFAMDAEAGRPLPGTRLLTQRLLRFRTIPILNIQKPIYEYSDAEVPDNGLFEAPFGRNPEGDPWNREYLAIARNGNDYALSDAGYYWYWWGYRDGMRSYGYTDRPVYRPGQTVHFKHTLRGSAEGRYSTPANADVMVRIQDPRGGTLYEKKLQTDEFGSISGSVELGSEPPLGMYSMSLQVDGNSVMQGPGSSFRVEEYKKPEFEVTIGTDKPTYKLGDTLKVHIHAEYYFGGPVPAADVEYTVQRRTFSSWIPWPRPFDWLYEEDGNAMVFRHGKGRFGIVPYQPQRSDLVKQGTLRTDAFGNATLELVTQALEKTPDADLEYVIEAKVVDQSRREIAASRSLKVTRHAFTLSLNPQKHLYQPADKVRVEVKAQNAMGEPVAIRGQAVISFVDEREQTDKSGNVKFPEKRTELSTRPMDVGASGRGELEFVADRQGYYKVVVTAPDPFGATIEGATYVWVAEGSGELAHYANRDLEIVLDKETFAVGETLHLLLTSKHTDAYVLLTAEADDLYYSQVVHVPESSATLDLAIPKSFQPNVTLTASLFRGNKIHQEERQILIPPVEDFLNVAIKAPKAEFQPREEAQIEVLVTDHKGQPAQAEISLGMVDASIFYIQSETRGDIRKFFHGNQRPRLVRTSSSYAFQFWAHGMAREGLMLNRFSGVGGRMAPGAEPEPMAAAEADFSVAAPMLKARRLGQEGQAADELKEATVRSEFPDTVFWAAHLVTGTDGKAATKIRFPDSLTTWRLTAIADTKETAVGEIALDVRTKKNVIVRLEAPRFFVERDSVVLSAIAHNYLDQPKKVRVSLHATPELTLLAAGTSASQLDPSGPGAEELFVDIEVPPQEERRVDFLAKARRVGKAKLLAKARTNEESDAVELEYPVLEYGAEKLLAQGGMVLGKSEGEDVQTIKVEIPEQIRAGSQRLTIKLQPTIAGVLIESLPYLLDYPYGCTEQTMSRFLPAVLTAHTLKTMGISLGEIKGLGSSEPSVAQRLKTLQKNPVYDAKELDKIIKAGLKRLADMQQPDGGWGWWKSDSSNPYVTAYVVSGLATAKRAGVGVDGMLERGARFLEQRVVQPEAITRFPWQAKEDQSVRVYMLHALGLADAAKLRQPDIHAQLRKTFAERDQLNDYSRALLALTLAAAPLGEEAEIVLANIKDRARIDAATGSASWGDQTGYYYWYQCGTEATSYSLQALVAIEPSSPLIPQVVNWLLRNRQGTRWFNTKDTAIACYSLAEYLRLTGELDPDLTITAEVAGMGAKTLHVTRENLFRLDDELVIAGDQLGTGTKEVSLKRKGRGNLYWSAYATFFTQEDKITEGGNELFVRRDYQRLIPREVEKTRMVRVPGKREPVEEKYREIEYEKKPLAEGEALKSGDLIEVNLAIKAQNNFEYLLFEDPKPAGCEAVELHSGYSWGEGLGGHREFRDERVAFFASYLNQGTYNLQYRLRAEIPGTFHALPARAECMYAPRVKGNGASHIVVIEEK